MMGDSQILVRGNLVQVLVREQAVQIPLSLWQKAKVAVLLAQALDSPQAVAQIQGQLQERVPEQWVAPPLEQLWELWLAPALVLSAQAPAVALELWLRAPERALICQGELERMVPLMMLAQEPQQAQERLPVNATDFRDKFLLQCCTLSFHAIFGIHFKRSLIAMFRKNIRASKAKSLNRLERK